MSFKENAQNALSRVLRRRNKKKIIIFESYPDFFDNTLAVFNEMLKRGYDKKYKLVWELGDKSSDTAPFKKYCADFIVRDYETTSEKIKHFYYTASASLFISSNRFINKQSADDSQKYLHLAHGCALKKTGNYYIPEKLKNAEILTLSDFFIKYDAINLGCREEQLLPLGYPRCDELSERININAAFSDVTFKKAIYWLPTYRQHISGKFVHSSVSFPIIYDDTIAQRINAFGSDNGVLIIVKPHPSQDVSLIKKLELSNIRFIDNDFLKDNGISNYSLLGSCDAMLSDYSSVYYDYLLCDKPIGLCFDDFDEYASKEGFTVDPEYILRGGEKIYNAEDLCGFIKRVADGEDLLRAERGELLKTVHKYTDFKASVRVVDYIKENYGI